MNKLLTRITTHRNILPRQEAHSRRVAGIYIVIACFLGLMALLACSCSPKHGCYGTKGMSGYGIIEKKTSKDGISVTYLQSNDTLALDYLTNLEYDSLCTILLKQSGVPFVKWKTKEAVTFTILDKEGKIICYYKESAK